MENVEYVVKEILADLAGIPFASLDDGATLAEGLELDSLELVKLAQELEEKLGVQLSDSDIQASMTVADLVRVVLSKQPKEVTS